MVELSDPAIDPVINQDTELNDALLFQRGEPLMGQQGVTSFYNSFGNNSSIAPNQVQTISVQPLSGNTTGALSGSGLNAGSVANTGIISSGGGVTVTAPSGTTASGVLTDVGGVGLGLDVVPGSLLSTAGGVISGLTQAASGQAFFKYVSDWLGRAIVVVLGFVFVAAGLFMLHDKQGVVVNVAKALKKGGEAIPPIVE